MLLTVAATGKLLPLQVIHQGKTPGSHQVFVPAGGAVCTISIVLIPVNMISSPMNDAGKNVIDGTDVSR